jgi:two-component system NarL family sensor kinase
VKAARKAAPRPGPVLELVEVQARLAEAEEALRAIRSGEVDTLVVEGRKGQQVFTLQGSERAYRLLIESMNEGALTLTRDKTILYANRCFAKMVKSPLKQVMGGSLRRYLSTVDQAMLRALLKGAGQSGSKIQVGLLAGDGSQMPVQISIRPTSKMGAGAAVFGIVVTDLTEARRSEELLRDLTHRIVQVQEDERGRVALELHDGITQLLCAIVFRSQALVSSLSASGGAAMGIAKKLRDMAGETVEEVGRVAHNLRPSVLDQLGMVAAMRDVCAEFAERTGMSVRLTCAQSKFWLTSECEMTLYRILQEALRNVEKHAGARNISVELAQMDGFVSLVVKDDGTGFNPEDSRAGRAGKGGLGLFGMRERMRHASGTLELASSRGGGTVVKALIPLRPAKKAPGRRARPVRAARPVKAGAPRA